MARSSKGPYLYLQDILHLQQVITSDDRIIKSARYVLLMLLPTEYGLVMVSSSTWLSLFEFYSPSVHVEWRWVPPGSGQVKSRCRVRCAGITGRNIPSRDLIHPARFRCERRCLLGVQGVLSLRLDVYGSSRRRQEGEPSVLGGCGWAAGWLRGSTSCCCGSVQLCPAPFELPIMQR